MPPTAAGLTSALEAFVARARALTDDELRVLAEARSAVDEEFHAGAVAAAAEALADGSEAYFRARRALARAHVPSTLEAASGDAREDWDRVSRLAQLAIDDALLALATSDTIHPKHVRELYRSFAVLA